MTSACTDPAERATTKAAAARAFGTDIRTSCSTALGSPSWLTRHSPGIPLKRAAVARGLDGGGEATVGGKMSGEIHLAARVIFLLEQSAYRQPKVPARS